MKKMLLLIGVMLTGLLGCQKQPDATPATTADTATVPSVPDGAVGAGRGASVLWRSAKSGENRIWRFQGEAPPTIATLWAVEPEWSPLAFVPQGWGENDLVVWRNANSGEIRLWKVHDEAEEPVFEVLPPAGAGWRIAAVLDVNADGNADLVWTRGDGDVAVWTLREGKVVEQAVIGNTGSGWTLTQAGDFDGDGCGDLFWRRDDRASATVWMLKGAAIRDSRGMADAGEQWTLLAAGRFDDALGADLLWRDGSGNLAIWGGADPAHASTMPRQAVAAWTLIAALDLDDNGRDDLLWNNGESNQLGAWMLAADGTIADSTLPPVGSDWTATSSALVAP